MGQLRQLVRQLATAEELGDQPANATVWLPSRQGHPQTRLGSFQRGVNALAGTTAPVNLEAWQVTGLTLDPFHTLTFLTRFTNQRLIEVTAPTSFLRHARLGNDVLFWSHASKYVLEILAGQNFLPGIRADHTGRFDASWKPALMEANLRQRLEALVAAMPPVCRAYNLPSLEAAPGSGALLEHFIATLVDRAIRQWIPSPPPERESTPATIWLHSLLNEHPQMYLPPQPAHQLYQQWLSWFEQLHATAADVNFQVAFRLEPAEDDRQEEGIGEPRWLLRYYLQAKDDPDLLIPVEEIWRGNSHSLRVNGRRFDQPQERLLAGLGIASRLFSPIRESLRTPRPEMAILSTEEAYQFLREIGPLLESSGFGILLPDWWHGRSRSRLGLRLRLYSDPRDQNERTRHLDLDADETLASDVRRGSQAELNLDSPIHFHWELTLGGQTLNEDEFQQLAAMHSPLVKMRGRWVEFDPEQVAAAQRFMQTNRTEGPMNLIHAVRMAQAYLQDREAAPITGIEFLPGSGTETPSTEALLLDTVEVEGWLDEALRRLRGQKPIAEIGEPAGFVGKLRPYQRRGVGWLYFLRRLGLGACLADDMGLGKTVETIGLLLHVRNHRHERDAESLPVLLICPTSVVANWRHEIERFAPELRPWVHHGSGRLSGEEFAAMLEQHDLVITSYGTARRDIEMLEQYEWSDLILDEAQNIKNPTAKQTQAVRRLGARNRIALTGTPVENRLLELWSIMEFLNPGYLDARERFRQQFVLPIERYNNDASAAELRRLVQPFLLRRLKTDPTIISDLPEKNEMIVYCPLTKEQATLYNRVVQETMERVERSEGIQRRGLVLSLLLKLKQVCNHPAHYLGEAGPLQSRSGKLNRLTEMLEEALSVGDRALVFTQFVEMGHLLQRHLEETFGREVLFLHGGTPAPKRDQMVQAFQAEKGGPPIFVLSLRAGGVGLNLTRANHVFHFDRWWNPAVENQATDRAFRIGQKRTVQVYKFVVSGTLEEHIHELIESKRSLAESIVGSGEDWLAEMDTEELRRLLALRREDVDEEALG